MRKTILIVLAIIGIFIASCKKENNLKTSNENCIISKIINYDNNDTINITYNSAKNIDYMIQNSIYKAEFIYFNNLQNKIVFKNIALNKIIAYDTLIYSGNNLVERIRYFDINSNGQLLLYRNWKFSYNSNNKISKRITIFYNTNGTIQSNDSIYYFYNSQLNLESLINYHTINNIVVHDTSTFSYNTNELKGNLKQIQIPFSESVPFGILSDDIFLNKDNNLCISHIHVDRETDIDSDVNLNYEFNSNGTIRKSFLGTYLINSFEYLCE